MPSRRRRPGDARFLQLRVALFWAGVIVWLVGILLGREAMTSVAIAILLAAAGLGLLARRSQAPTGDDRGEEDRDP